LGSRPTRRTIKWVFTARCTFSKARTSIWRTRSRETVLARILQKLLARGCEVPLLDGGMLGRHMKIAHPPLQR